MAFHLGSLGFLTPFNFENFQSQVTQVIQGELECSRTLEQSPRRDCLLTWRGFFLMMRRTTFECFRTQRLLSLGWFKRFSLT